ncbi:MAG: response regulator [Deltaproteobacteria bacterium]|nr:response regulator [Deltaproteobacteria bacterium]
MQHADDWKIIFIDDEKDIRDVMKITLADAGYNVLTAEDGQTGLRMCNEFLPQIVITDIRMPGMDGIRVLESIKKKYPTVEVIVVTAFGEMELAIRALQLDASDFITKPIHEDALHLALERAKYRYTSRKQISDYTSLLEREKADTTEELIKTTSFRNNLIENSIDGILASDERGVVVTFNKSMERMLGIPKDDVLHKMTLDSFFPSGKKVQFKEELNGEGYGGKNHLFLYETVIKNHSNRFIPVQVSASVLFDKARESGVVGFFRDLRELRRLEQEITDHSHILHQDKMMSLGRLAASVVHEINNPLTGILNYINLMDRILKRGPLEESKREKFLQYLDLVEKETSRCSQIVSSLLTFSRRAIPSFEQVKVDELLDKCIILSQHTLELNNISLEKHIHPKLPSVKGDGNQLQQCIINLIFNAIDAMKDAGILSLIAEHNPEKGIVKITVKDTGSGIREEDLQHIFEPFFTTKKERFGVGLGLSTVYGIMKQHGGNVTVESKLNAGSAFTLELPVL